MIFGWAGRRESMNPGEWVCIDNLTAVAFIVRKRDFTNRLSLARGIDPKVFFRRIHT
jgi:hypothetical protein